MMNAVQTSELVVRRATRADLSFVAWCNYEATSPAPGFCYWDPLLEGLNTDTMMFIEAVFHADALAWGKVEDFFFVEEQGRLIGGASGFVMDEHDYRPLKLSRLPAVAERLGWDEATLARFQAGYEMVWNDPHDVTLKPSAPWVIECVAVVPEARGRGVAKRLMRAILDEGTQRGFSHAAIAVTMGNTSAERVYTGVGFQLYIAYGADYFDGTFPGTTKYRMRLN
jgi:ribosomal protein S18 acetylase RimI-like enzyme